MKNFIEHVQKSIYSPEYYRDLLSRPASFSWKYYWSFAMLISVVMTIAISLPMVPRIDRALHDASKKVLEYYPPDLVITVASGLVSINQPEPYTFPLPAILREAANEEGITALMSIDTTQDDVTLERFESYHSVFLLDKKSLIAGDERNGLRVLDFPSGMNITVDRLGIKSILLRLESFAPLVAPTIILLLFFGFLSTFVLLLVYLLLDALFIMLIGRYLKYGWSYTTSYRIGLHAVTLPLLFSSVLSLVPIGNVSLPFLTALLTLVVVYMNFKDRVIPNAAPIKRGTDMQ